MHCLVYVSAATVPFAPAELVGLLEQSRAKNASLGVTGMLAYDGGNLMQVLEGDRETVSSLFATISRDPRHHGVLTLLDEEVPVREFDGWSMAFREVDAATRADLPGWSDFLQGRGALARADDPAATAGAARVLLRSFRDSIR